MASLNADDASGVICESAGTGRQARLRGVCQPTWEFKSPLSHHNSTLILIESGYCYFYQKPQYFWAFQRFKADLGCSRDRPFLLLWGFPPIPVKLGFVGLFFGSLILWVGSLDLSLGSLDLWGVR